MTEQTPDAAAVDPDAADLSAPDPDPDEFLDAFTLPGLDDAREEGQ